MAHWQRRNSGYVYIYTRKNGRQKALPRKQVKHLDGQEDHNIEAWVKQWEEQYENKTITPDKILFDNSELSQYIKAYLGYLKSRKRKAGTIEQHDRMLRRYVIPFFLENNPPLRDPQQWPGKSIKFLSWLEEKKVTAPVIHRCNVALKGIYNYLVDEGIVQTGLAIRLRHPVPDDQSLTPLQFTLSPDEVLKFVNDTKVNQLKLMALLGYFFSLRPQEVFALQLSNFKASGKQLPLECCKTMNKIGLFGRLAVNIISQRDNSSNISTPKKESGGWVACFNEEAARLIVELIKSNDPSDLILTQKNRWLYDQWKMHGIKDITLKDLRRASIYWLGHSISIQPIELMKHARHQTLETTMLYLRRPEEQLESITEFSLDA